jgi:hypothetical protein
MSPFLLSLEAKARYQLSMLRFRQKRFDEAWMAAERAASLASNDAQIRVHRDHLHVWRNQSMVDLLLSRESLMNNLSVSEVIFFHESRGVVTRGFNVERPVKGVLVSGDLFVVAGWIIGKTSRAVEVNVLLSEELIAVALININRPDVERAYPVEEVKSSGFRVDIPVVSLQGASEINLIVKLADGAQVPLAKICFEKQVETGTAMEEGSKAVGSISEQGAVLTEKESTANTLARVAPPMRKSARPKSRKTSAAKRKKSR